MNKKTLIIAGVIIGVVLLQPQVEAQAIWFIKRVIYAHFASGYGVEGWENLRDNITEVILANPPLEGLRDLMENIMRLVFAFYLPAIISLGVYLLFLSTSPRGRAKAKSMFSRLVIGFIVVSLSPRLMELILKISWELTSSILAFTETGIYSEALSKSIGQIFPYPQGIIGLHFLFTIVNIELGFYLFLFLMFLVWGSFLFPIVVRFLAVSIFIILFPLSLFLYSFEFTRALGRMMVEQTLVWTFLQAVNALVVLTAVLCISTLPADYMKISFFLPGLIPIVASFMFPIAPLFIMRFFRGFLP